MVAAQDFVESLSGCGWLQLSAQVLRSPRLDADAVAPPLQAGPITPARKQAPGCESHDAAEAANSPPWTPG